MKLFNALTFRKWFTHGRMRWFRSFQVEDRYFPIMVDSIWWIFNIRRLPLFPCEPCLVSVNMIQWITTFYSDNPCWRTRRETVIKWEKTTHQCKILQNQEVHETMQLALLYWKRKNDFETSRQSAQKDSSVRSSHINVTQDPQSESTKKGFMNDACHCAQIDHIIFVSAWLSLKW